MTYRFAVQDILSDLKKTYDDRDFSVTQILFWLMNGANAIRKSDLLKFDNGDGIHLTRFNNLSVTFDNYSKRQIFTLPKQVIDLEYNRGIFISYLSQDDTCDPPTRAVVPFTPTQYETMKRLYDSNYERPSPRNPYFYRVGQVITLEGTQNVSIGGVDVALYTTLNPLDLTSLDGVMPIPDEKYNTLKVQLLQLGLFLENIPEQSLNTGSDETKTNTVRATSQAQQTQQQPAATE